MENKHVFLCISNYFKGSAFLRRLSSLGNTVYLITSEKLREADWPHEHIAETFYMPGQDLDWNMEHLLLGVADLMRRSPIHAIVALDDYDVEKATYLREHLRIPGMGQTTGRYFRDKLAMRMRAHSAGIRVPAFSPLFVDEQINAYIAEVPGPGYLSRGRRPPPMASLKCIPPSSSGKKFIAWEKTGFATWWKPSAPEMSTMWIACW
ncbi:ATP-grasp domain-containing protein [Nitritalea halalkaliphila]|uniref:ATP-grasp domain-containing protein n=1 Tax=Nitritalea halalkaliphila TaxID=590849 RepID=UPI0002E7880D|nr:hypothetical protein [Nitritalea halalkaliphila]